MPIINPNDFMVEFGGGLAPIKDVYGDRIQLGLDQAGFVTSIPDISNLQDELGFQKDKLATLASLSTIENYSKIGAVIQGMRAYRTGIISSRVEAIQSFVGDSVLGELLNATSRMDLRDFVADGINEIKAQVGKDIMSVLGPALPIISEAVSAIPLINSYVRVASNVFRLIRDNWIDPERRAPDVRCLRPWSGNVAAAADQQGANDILRRYALENPGNLNQFYIPAPGCVGTGGREFGFTLLLVNDEVNGKIVDRGMRLEYGFERGKGGQINLMNTLPGLGKMIGWDIMGRNFKRQYDKKTHTALGFDGPRHHGVTFPFETAGDRIFDLADRVPSVSQVADQFWSGITLNSPSAFHINPDIISESWHDFFTTSPTQMLATGAEWCSLKGRGLPDATSYCNMGVGANDSYLKKYNENRLHTFIGPAANYLTRNFFPIILYKGVPTGGPGGTKDFPYRCAAFDSFRSLAASKRDPRTNANVDGSLAHGKALDDFTVWLVGQIESASPSELQNTFFHPRIANLKPGYWFTENRYESDYGLASMPDVISGLRKSGPSLHMQWTGVYGNASGYDQYPMGAYPPLPLLPNWMKSKGVTEWSFVSLYWWVKYLMKQQRANQLAFATSTTAAYLDTNLGAFQNLQGLIVRGDLNSVLVNTREKILQTPRSMAAIDDDMISDAAFRQELVKRRAQQFQSGTSTGGKVPDPQEIPGESSAGPTVGIDDGTGPSRSGGSMMPLLLAGGAVLALSMMRKRR